VRGRGEAGPAASRRAGFWPLSGRPTAGIRLVSRRSGDPAKRMRRVTPSSIWWGDGGGRVGHHAGQALDPHGNARQRESDGSRSSRANRRRTLNHQTEGCGGGAAETDLRYGIGRGLRGSEVRWSGTGAETNRRGCGGAWTEPLTPGTQKGRHRLVTALLDCCSRTRRYEVRADVSPCPSGAAIIAGRSRSAGPI
jgi:hypothetical protein